MASQPYETNSIGWQLQQLGRRLGEWWERTFRQVFSSTGGEPPAWLVPLFWAIAAALAVLLIWLLYKILRPYILQGNRRRRVAKPASAETVEPTRTVAEWLQRSRRLAEQHDYREACRCLYQALLQQLDDRQKVPQQLSRTDGEYWRLLRSLPNARSYQVLINTHERLCFSDTEISAETYRHCQQAYQEIAQP